MTPDQERALRESIAANKRHLQLLDSRIVELKSIREAQALERRAHAIERAGRQPYFYGVQAYDESGLLSGIQNGIPIFDEPPTGGLTSFRGAETTKRFRGIIQLDEDAPFVWTHMAVASRYVLSTTDAADENLFRLDFPAPFQSVRGPVAAAGIAVPPPPLGLGFTESGSGRVLFQAQTFDRNTPGSNPKKTNGLLGAGVFDTRRNYGDTPRTAAGVSAAAPGQGPSQAMPLPSQVVLPASGAVEVEVRPEANWAFRFNSIEPTGGRFILIAYITLVGYKLLEE